MRCCVPASLQACHLLLCFVCLIDGERWQGVPRDWLMRAPWGCRQLPYSVSSSFLFLFICHQVHIHGPSVINSIPLHSAGREMWMQRGWNVLLGHTAGWRWNGHGTRALPPRSMSRSPRRPSSRVYLFTPCLIPERV